MQKLSHAISRPYARAGAGAQGFSFTHPLEHFENQQRLFFPQKKRGCSSGAQKGYKLESQKKMTNRRKKKLRLAETAVSFFGLLARTRNSVIFFTQAFSLTPTRPTYFGGFRNTSGPFERPLAPSRKQSRVLSGTFGKRLSGSVRPLLYPIFMYILPCAYVYILPCVVSVGAIEEHKGTHQHNT